MYTELDIGYLAALYEGEGTCNRYVRHDPPRSYAQLVIRMTDKEPLERLHRTFGGNFTGPYSEPSRSSKGYKPIYRWSVGKLDGFEELANLIFPLLSPRRQGQIQEALDNIEWARNQPIVPGSRLRREPSPQRPRCSGELVCPDAPEPSARGYQRHRLLGIPVCDTCRTSANLYYSARRNSWYRDRIKEINRDQYLKNRRARIETVREYRANKKTLKEARDLDNIKPEPLSA